MSVVGRNNQQIPIRFSQSGPQKRENAQKNGILPPLDKVPASVTNSRQEGEDYPIVDMIHNLGSEERHPHLSSQERRRRNKLVTFWRTRGAHDLILEQNRNLERQKEKKAEEAERLKEKKKQALKERMIEKKVEQAHMRGEIYIPSEEDKTEEKPDPKSSSKTSPVRKSEEKLEMLQKKVFVMPTGEPLPKNVAFLAENVDENRAQKYYKERKVKPGPEYEKKWGISYEQKQKNFNTYNALYCLCNPVYQWSRTDLFTKEQEKMAEDIRRLLRYKTTEEGEPVYLMGDYRVGSYQQHETWFPLHTGFYLWFNILENPKSQFLRHNHYTFLQFHLTEVNAKQIKIICYSIDTTNNEALKKSRTSAFPDLYYDVVKGGVYKSQLFSDAEFVVNVNITEAFEQENSHSTCLLWITCAGKAWLGNAWAATKRPSIMFREKPDKKSTKKKLNF